MVCFHVPDAHGRFSQRVNGRLNPALLGIDKHGFSDGCRLSAQGVEAFFDALPSSLVLLMVKEMVSPRFQLLQWSQTWVPIFSSSAVDARPLTLNTENA